MNVLIIGYGKIGRIKAFLWQTLGLSVSIYDVAGSKLETAIQDGFSVYNKDGEYHDIVDISTPAGKHYMALRWCLDQENINPKRILIEKPLASTVGELNKFHDLIKTSKELANKLFINESYYQSVALERLVDEVTDPDTNIKSINIELSKNRQIDYELGRFIDTELDAIGIEVPHMLAILDTLGVEVATLATGNSVLQVDRAKRQNQAFSSKLATTPRIELNSYLGSFRNANPNESTIANHTVRTLAVSTTSEVEYLLEFDPAPDCPRHHSKLTITRPGLKPEVTVVEDNHLLRHLALFVDNKYLSQKNKIGIQKGIAMTEVLIAIRKQCVIKYRESDTHTLGSHKKG